MKIEMKCPRCGKEVFIHPWSSNIHHCSNSVGYIEDINGALKIPVVLCMECKTEEDIMVMSPVRVYDFKEEDIIMK